VPIEINMPIARNRFTARLARLAASCVAVAAIWACGPVYIPVPPPYPAETTFATDIAVDQAGKQRQVWIAMGVPDSRAAGATFYVFDQDQQAGVISRAEPDGSYVAPPMDGTEGDRVSVYYRDTRGELSGTNCVILSTSRPVAACQ
jgi:hypothetical protein